MTQARKSVATAAVFWARCPHCKKTFGVQPRFIAQYLERLQRTYPDAAQSATALLTRAQDDAGRIIPKKRAA